MSDFKFRGVYPQDGGWVVKIGHKGKENYLGMFSDFESAKAVRIDAEVRMFGAPFDRREIEICDDYAKIPLHGREGKFYGWALVDLVDVAKAEVISWTLDPRGYVAGRLPGSKTTTTLHRWLMLDGEKCRIVVDHINGDKLDNRRSNLRLCSQSQNTKNTLVAKDNRSGIKGVSQKSNGKWRARIMVARKEIALGTFDTAEEAQAAYDKAAIEHHGDFASPNKGVR